MPELLSHALERAKAHREPDWLVQARRDALASYAKVEPPAWRRRDLHGLDIEALAMRAAAEAPALRPIAAREGVVHLPLTQAAREHPDLVKPVLAAPVVGPDKWGRLRNAIWSGGSLLFVEKDVQLEEPITLEEPHGPHGAVLRDVVVLERGAKATLLARARGSGPGAVSLAALDVEVRDNAQLSLATLQDVHPGAMLLATRRAVLARDARLAWMDGQFGGRTVVVPNETVLEGPGSSLAFFGAFFGSRDQHFDITTSAWHTGRHTSSQLHMKGALNEDGYSVNYSIVNIGPDARNASGHQHQETLVLSDKARADAIPKLDVENNEVSASHGATVGQVDPEQVFYLRSRGFSEPAAKRLIVEGFFEPLLREIPLEDAREEIRGAIVARLRG